MSNKRSGRRQRAPRKPAHLRKRPRDDQRNQRRRRAALRLWNASVAWALEHGRPVVLPFFGSMNQYPCSNHALVPTRYKGKDYATSEHAYLAEQARCYGLHQLAEAWTIGKGGVREAGRWYDWSNPKHVKAFSTKAFRPFKNPRLPARQSWLAKRDREMFRIVLSKFKGDRSAKRALLATGHQYLVEASPQDAHWGVGVRASTDDLQWGPLESPLNWGENQLGKILMAVRNVLRVRIQQAKLITNRARRHLVALQAKRNAAMHGPNPITTSLMMHFSRQFVTGVKRAAEPKRKVLETAPLPALGPAFYHRNLRKRPLAHN